MKWIKLGKIFDPLHYELSDKFLGYAQSPQALVFDNFVRIYFSTRKKSENGKYISYIQFVDMTNDFKQVINTSKHTVIELGKLGCFDEHGIFPMNVVKHKDRIYGYTSGWTRRVSVSVDASIGLAISDDNGFTFVRVGDGPILTSSLNEPFLVADPFVKIIENTFHMWYIYGTGWKKFSEGSAPDRTYKIGHAYSQDGINWHKEGRKILTDKYEFESQALPTVIKIDNKWHMFYCYRQSFDFRNNKDNAYRIGIAYSNDLINWIRDDDNVGIGPSESGWDSDMMCYPHVFECDNEIFMLYNGNEFGRYGFGIAKLVK
jgi:hypothetical protein